MEGYTLITGACGGLGKAFVELLASRGESLFLTGRSEERLEALAAEVQERFDGIDVQYRACDLTDSNDRRAFFESLNVPVKRLVYCAGVDNQMAFERYSEDKLAMQARVNFEGAVSFLRGALAHATLDGKTELLVIGSMSGVSPMPYFALYSATKKALEHFTAALRVELKGRAKVTCVLPGSIPTRADIIENINAHGSFSRMSALPAQTVAKRALKAVKKNKRKTVIGFWNKLLRFGMALLPLSLRMRVISKIWKKTEKEAY